MLVLYLASEQSSLSSPVRISDKVAHVAAYAVLGVLALRAFHGGLNWLGAWPTAGAFLLTVAYGALDEVHQVRVPGRVAGWDDWLADCLGAGLAVFVVALALLLRSARPGRGAPKTGALGTGEVRR
jgi:VanZ family protein